jgi:co-chaperonin GroES (HSP10)
MTWSQLRILGPRILVKLDPPATVTAGGIAIPDNLTYQPGAGLGKHTGSLGDRYGTCVAVGTGHWLEGSRGRPAVHQPVPIAVGERVLFGMYNGTKIPAPSDDPDGEYWVMTTSPMRGDINPEVWGVLEPESEAAQ